VAIKIVNPVYTLYSLNGKFINTVDAGLYIKGGKLIIPGHNPLYLSFPP